MNPLQRFIGFISQPDHKRTLTILAALAILAAIPLTVYVAQQQQDIRQRAAEVKYICTSNGTTYNSSSDCEAICDTTCSPREEPPPPPPPSECQCVNNQWYDGGTGACAREGKGEGNSCNEPTPAPTTPPSIPTPTPISGGGNYCTANGFHECTPGTSAGSCTKDGKTCTAYEVYTCNFGGKNYCGSTSCAEPCTSGGGTPPTPTPRVGGPPPSPVPTSPPSGSYPKGVHDVASCTVIQGWTCDPDNYSQPLEVAFYKMDGEPGSGADYLGSTVANQEREQGVGNECGGNRNHGFTFSTPDRVKDGQPHRIWTYVKDLGSNLIPPLTNTPKTITCQGTSPTPTSIPPTRIARLPADVNGDNCISILDFNEWLFAFKNNGTPRNQNHRPDINGDGRVDIIDFNLWLRSLQSGQNLCTSSNGEDTIDRAYR